MNRLGRISATAAGAGAIAGVAAFAGRWRAKRAFEKDAEHWLDVAVAAPGRVVEVSELDRLPPPVSRWLLRSGIIGRERIVTLHATQRGRLHQAADKPWINFTAEQYCITEPVTLLWLASASIAGVPLMLAYDTFIDGHGAMDVRIGGVIPIEKARGLEVDEGTLHRWLSEIASIPSAALDERIAWRGLEDDSAEATMTLGELAVTAVFTFDDEGWPIRVDADRFRAVDGGFVRTPWSALLSDHREVQGITIPHHVEAVWHLEEGDLTALVMEFETVEYDVVFNQHRRTP